MELNLQGVFGLHVTWRTCIQYSLAEPPQPIPSPHIWTRIWGRYWPAEIDDISLWPSGLGDSLTCAVWCSGCCSIHCQLAAAHELYANVPKHCWTKKRGGTWLLSEGRREGSQWKPDWLDLQPLESRTRHAKPNQPSWHSLQVLTIRVTSSICYVQIFLVNSSSASRTT